MGVEDLCVRVHVCVHVCVRVRVRVRVDVRICVCARACVRARARVCLPSPAIQQGHTHTHKSGRLFQ